MGKESFQSNIANPHELARLIRILSARIKLLENASGSGGAGSFILQSDTPEAYLGEAGKIVAVNVGETGVEFVNNPTNLLIHYQTFTLTDSTVIGTDTFTIAPAYTNGIKMASMTINGFTFYNLSNGTVKDISDIAGINYELDILQNYWLDTVGTNLTIAVTNGTNELVNNIITVVMVYEDIAAPGGK